MNKTPEEILSDHNLISIIPLSVIPGLVKIMKEYARQERDKALEWAAENVSAILVDNTGDDVPFVSKQSILAGKTSKDLAI